MSEGANKPASRGKYSLHRGDLPAEVEFGATVAIDTEAMGLNPHRDRLCVVQLSSGDGSAIWSSSMPATTRRRTCGACSPTPR